VTRKVIIHAEVVVPPEASDEDVKWLERDLGLFARIKIQDELSKLRVSHKDACLYFQLTTDTSYVS